MFYLSNAASPSSFWVCSPSLTLHSRLSCVAKKARSDVGQGGALAKQLKPERSSTQRFRGAQEPALSDSRTGRWPVAVGGPPNDPPSLRRVAGKCVWVAHSLRSGQAMGFL